MSEGKGTDDAYKQHVKDYKVFWEKDQAAKAKEDPSHALVPAYPIVGAKVALFLQYKISRPKCNHCGEDLPGTSIGKESIKQTVSALQLHMQEHQHLPEYAACHNTQILL
ncbi:hypothetical protein CPB83DRAFT_839170 [Crepidotus variabilis]|uniref:Uncharacterized protein n=1 Tax=Crepidotus variabilis TaxID=179855 RepID=A0A9P6JKE9_9AGAR|nr:hypothetical protein CPB83DRAFT_839170 [Crepidotus variabilis]